ncbi:MAG: BTAD domain-containing putative transcriptional regulator [Ardenticatenaceae bacterium]|nr:BTAD domain-containing putative transcriptional regulator [Ardenticatenaceae bacterium]
MAILHLQLLGTFQASLDGEEIVAFRSDKIRALLAYLALEGDHIHPRDALATLLWGDFRQTAARASLRQALSNLRSLLAPLLAADPPALQISRQTVGLNTGHPAIQVDVVDLRYLLRQVDEHPHADLQRCPACREKLEVAVDLYRGDFLPNLQLEGSADFDEWRLLQQEKLHQQVLHALQTLSGSYAVAGDLVQQAAVLRRLLTLMPWEENAHRELMDVLARSGQRAAALTQYERCREILETELGIEPTAETTALFRLIESGDLPADAPAVQPTHNLPPPTTPLIGRDGLLEEVASMLPAPTTRLVTLLGPGGVGKTRLALAAAQEVIHHFAGGVWFVPLAEIGLGQQSDGHAVRHLLAGAINDEIQLPLQKPDDPWSTLVAFLQAKTSLLVLDNLEQLLPQTTRFVLDLMEVAPNVTILITSQIRLRTRAEKVVALTGLNVPQAETFSLESAAQSGGIALFAECAGRSLVEFTLDEKNIADVAEICRLVDGLPLAIELTAALIEHATPSEIAATLENNIALLADSPGAADLPQRQQSIQAVFEYAWRLLTPAEQPMLAQMSLFRGEFGREAAMAVTGGSLTELAALIDKSLLRVVRPGRYVLHALVRHFAAAALHNRPALLAAAKERYAQTYHDFLQQRHRELLGPQQPQAVTAIHSDLDNIRHAWELALATADIDLLESMVVPLAEYFIKSGKSDSGNLLFATAAADLTRKTRLASAARRLLLLLEFWQGYLVGESGHLEPAVSRLTDVLPRLRAIKDRETVARCRYALGAFNVRLGHLERSLNYLQDARQDFAELADSSGLATTLSVLGLTWEARGEYARAEEAYAQSLILLREVGQPLALSKGLSNFGLLLHFIGENERAAALLSEAVELDEHGSNRSTLGASLANLGLVMAAKGAYDEAAGLYRRALAIQQDVGNRARVAILLNNLGDVANLQGDYDVALAYLQESLTLKREMGNERSMTFSLVHLGHVYWNLEQEDEAVSAFRQALLLAQKLDLKPLQLAVFVGLSQIALARSEDVLAREMLTLAADHPASWHRVRQEAAAVAEEQGLVLLREPQRLPDLAEFVQRVLDSQLWNNGNS